MIFKTKMVVSGVLLGLLAACGGAIYLANFRRAAEASMDLADYLAVAGERTAPPWLVTR